MKLRPFQGEIKASPLIMETASSALAGLFLLLWGLLYFSNPLYQLSMFTKLRNAFISEDEVRSRFSGITCIAVDSERYLAAEEEKVEGESLGAAKEKAGAISLRLVAEALGQAKSHALANPDKKIVVGVDYAIVGNPGGALSDIVRALDGMPDNLFVVFGGVLTSDATDTSTLRANLLYERLILKATKDEAGERNFFIGNLNILMSSVRSGAEEQAEMKAAVAHIPVLRTASSTFFSLPLTMFIVGEVMEKTTEGGWIYDFRTDFGDGRSEYLKGGDFENRFQEKTGKSLAGMEDLLYYDFFTSKNVTELPGRIINLSSISGSHGKPGIDVYLQARNELDRSDRDSPSCVEYFFIASTGLPKYMLSGEKTNDEILTLASEENPYLYEPTAVYGVMAHMTALANIRDKSYISPALVASALAAFAVALSVFILAWMKKKIPGILLSTCAILAAYLVLSFILFAAFGLFIQVKAGLVTATIAFSVVILIRFVYTMDREELYETLAAKVLSPSQARRLSADPNARKPMVVKGVAILVLFPHKLPPLGSSREDAEKYESVHEKYLQLATATMERHDGGRMPLHMDGIVGFWGVPFEAPEGLACAWDCAKDFMRQVPEWRKIVRDAYGDDVDASFDICLHSCSCYAGCLDNGISRSYALSGEELNATIARTHAASRDEHSSLLMSATIRDGLVARRLLKESETNRLPGEGEAYFEWKTKRR
jgi:class 3 adenylate cyclase